MVSLAYGRVGALVAWREGLQWMRKWKSCSSEVKILMAAKKSLLVIPEGWRFSAEASGNVREEGIFPDGAADERNGGNPHQRTWAKLNGLG